MANRSQQKTQEKPNGVWAHNPCQSEAPTFPLSFQKAFGRYPIKPVKPLCQRAPPFATHWQNCRKCHAPLCVQGSRLLCFLMAVKVFVRPRLRDQRLRFFLWNKFHGFLISWSGVSPEWALAANESLTTAARLHSPNQQPQMPLARQQTRAQLSPTAAEMS